MRRGASFGVICCVAGLEGSVPSSGDFSPLRHRVVGSTLLTWAVFLRGVDSVVVLFLILSGFAYLVLNQVVQSPDVESRFPKEKWKCFRGDELVIKISV